MHPVVNGKSPIDLNGTKAYKGIGVLCYMKDADQNLKGKTPQHNNNHNHSKILCTDKPNLKEFFSWH